MIGRTLIIILFIYSILAFIAVRNLIFLSGTLGHNWDWSIPVMPSYLRRASEIALFIWDDLQLGHPISIWFPASLLHGIIGVVGYFNLSGSFVSKVLVYLTMLIASMSMFVLAAYILSSRISKTSNQNQEANLLFPAFIAGLFYGFSPFLYSAFIGGSIAQFIPYAFIPLTFYYSLRYCSSGDKKYLICSAFLLSIVGFSLQDLVIITTVLFFYFTVQKNWASYLRRFGLILLLYSALNIEWFITIFVHIGSIANVYMSNEFTHLENIKGGFPHLLKCFSFACFGDRHFFIRSIHPILLPLWWLTAFSQTIVVFSGSLIKTGKVQIFWIVFLLAGLTWSAGVNTPLFGNVIHWLYKNFSIMNIFRTSQNILPLNVFSFAILVGISVFIWLQKVQALRIMRVSTGLIHPIIVIGMLFYLHPFFLHGDMGSSYLKLDYTPGNYLDVFEIPDEYKEVVRKLENDKDVFRILPLPMVSSPLYLRTPYQWHAQGNDPFLAHSPFSIVISDFAPQNVPYSKMFSNELERILCDAINSKSHSENSLLFKLMPLANIKYILLRKDVLPGFGYCVNKWDWIKANNLLLRSYNYKYYSHGDFVDLFELNEYNPKVYSSNFGLIGGTYDSLVSQPFVGYFNARHSLVSIEQQDAENLVSFVKILSADSTQGNYSMIINEIMFANSNYHDMVLELIKALWKGQKVKVSDQKPVFMSLNEREIRKFWVESEGIYELWIKAQGEILDRIDAISAGGYNYFIDKRYSNSGKWIKLGSAEFKKGTHTGRLLPARKLSNEAFLKPMQDIEVVIVSEEGRKENMELLKRRPINYLFYKEKEPSTATQQVIGKRDFYIPRDKMYEVNAFIRPKREVVRSYAINERFENDAISDWNFRRAVSKQEFAMSDRANNNIEPILLFDDNFYLPGSFTHPLQNKVWRWMANDGNLVILNPVNSAVTVNFSFSVASFAMYRKLDIYVNRKYHETVDAPGPLKTVSKKVINRIKDIKDLSLVSGNPIRIELKALTLQPGINEITLSPSPSATLVGKQNRFAVSIAISDDIRVVLTEPDSKTSSWVNRTSFNARIQNESLMLEDNYQERGPEIAWISRPIEKVSLNDYPLFIIKYAWQNPQLQAMDVGFRIDTDGDGKGDTYLVRSLPDPVPGLNRYEIDLLETVWENFADALNPYLVGIDLFPHKKWGVDASGVQGENRQSYFVKGIQVASKEGSVVVKGKESFRETTFYGKGSYSVSQDGDGLAVSLSLGGRKGESASTEVNIPLRQQPGAEASLFVLPYKLSNEQIQDLKVFVSYDLNNDGKADKTVPAGRRIPIPGWKLLTRDMKEPMFLYEATLPSFFPAEYNTAGKRFRNFVVIKDGVPLSPTWGSEFVISREQVQVEGGKVIINLPRGVDPDDFNYEVFYTPKEWIKESSWFHGYKELVFDMRDLEEDLFEKKVKPVELKLVLEGKISEAVEQERIYDFDIRAPRYAYSVLPRLGNLSVKENMPIISLDGEALKFDEERVDKGKGGIWVNQRISLKEGEHRLRVVEGGGLEAYLVEIKPVASQQSAVESRQPPKIDFKKINPTRYIVDVKDATGPFTLVFSESFHEGWKAYIRQIRNPQSAIRNQENEPWSALWSAWKDRGQRIEVKDHFVVNGYANGWIVDPSAGTRQRSAVGGQQSEEPSAVDGRQSFEMVLEYKPQRLFEIGLMISGLTLLGCFGYLGYDFVRRRKINE